MKKLIRVVFYAHAVIALYCLCMAILDGMENRPLSLIPSSSVLTGMVVAAFVLPCANLVFAWRAHVNAFWVFFGHALVGGAQLLFGIAPLFS